MSQFPFFEVEQDQNRRIATLFLNRPEARNAMDWSFWRDLPLVVDQLEADDAIRSIVIAGRGKSFSTGLDIVSFFDDFGHLVQAENGDGRVQLRDLIVQMQSGLNRIAAGRKVYVAAIHKHCIGGALDLIAACDIRLASKDASFSLREAKVAIVADMGSLNRLPGIIGMGNTKLMALTGDDFSAEEALQMQLVSRLNNDQTAVLEAARELAASIAANPRLAVQGTKEVLRYVQDHSEQDGLDHVLLFNTAFIDSLDLREMGAAFKERRRPRFR